MKPRGVKLWGDDGLELCRGEKETEVGCAFWHVVALRAKRDMCQASSLPVGLRCVIDSWNPPGGEMCECVFFWLRGEGNNYNFRGGFT